MRRLLVLLACVLFAVPLYAGTFTNGGFEDGTFSGWTQGAGSWNGAWPIDPNLYLPGGARYDMSYWRGDIVTPGPDPVVGNLLNQVAPIPGNQYSARINDLVDNYDYSVGVISQTVTNYTDPTIYFAWAAVLEESHDATDSDNFTLKLTDDTTAETLYLRAYSSFSAPAGLFHAYNNWNYTNWQVETLDVSLRQGHSFTLSLLAADCAWGGHAGYVYLDGFGSVIPVDPVPEPGTLALIGTGLLGLFRARFRKR